MKKWVVSLPVQEVASDMVLVLVGGRSGFNNTQRGEPELRFVVCINKLRRTLKYSHKSATETFCGQQDRETGRSDQ